ncbi:MAG: division/cell wall cluster transcriptional repressor MraZ [Oscillospiraceae bacterium]|nr:division/cell wall cluster transcriptional repressor MraZ [Oscillospiraceae bacterium]
MLIGRYDYALDAKNRLNYPARFRAEMGETFVVTCWLSGCLIAFPSSKWEDMADQLAACNLADARALQHKLFPNAIEVTPDKQGRIQLSPTLMKHAGLSKDVTVVGMGRYAEIWDTAAWDAHEAAGDDGALEQAIRLMNIR